MRLRDCILYATGIIVVAMAVACMLSSCSPIPKRIIAKETGSTRLGSVTHFLVADDGTTTPVGTAEYYHTAVGDSFAAYNWSY